MTKKSIILYLTTDSLTVLDETIRESRSRVSTSPTLTAREPLNTFTAKRSDECLIVKQRDVSAGRAKLQVRDK